jgi:SprT protein
MKKQIDIFEKYLPVATVPYCYDLWQTHHFAFKITKPRNSKFGDYSYRQGKGHQITVNGDLNPFAFLVTYIHEVAHLVTFNEYGSKPNPHGKEWKRNFLKLFTPLLQPSIIPESLLLVLKDYLKNPAASTQGSQDLLLALRTFDTKIHESDKVELSSLPTGANFELQGKIFNKGELRRTRYLCTDTKGRRYVISSLALVSKI